MTVASATAPIRWALNIVWITIPLMLGIPLVLAGAFLLLPGMALIAVADLVVPDVPPCRTVESEEWSQSSWQMTLLEG